MQRLEVLESYFVLLFTEYKLKQGGFLKLQVFAWSSAEMLQVAFGLHISEEDFPKVNFEKFAKRSMFKKSQ